MIEFKYRPDVDGLRAIAVVLVMLYHAGLGFSGGFVGVDVFFVISGFVITGLILKEQRAQKFSLKDFWIRRLRRILPALTIVVLVVLLVGGCFLFPSDFEKLAKSALYQQLMASNFFFMETTGYFEAPAEHNPLLHTWSLAVEEQFYLAFPFFLVLMRRFNPRTTACTLFVLIVGSFTLSECGVRMYQTATFYMLPTRGWELMAGAILCFLPAPKLLGPRSLNALSLLGIGGILWASLFFDSTTRFPGAAALFPCVGTALIIFSNSRNLTWIGRGLASKPLVAIGLISYSLYLWHWPILSFAELIMIEPPSWFLRLLALISSFGLAYLSWRFVEMPFRKGVVLPSTRRMLVTASASMALVVFISITVDLFEGFPSRIPQRILNYRSASLRTQYTETQDLDDIASGNLPVFGDPAGQTKCLVWGDSHAMALIPGIEEVCKANGITGYQVTFFSTAPVLDFSTNYSLKERAPAWNQAVFDFAQKNKIDLIIIAGIWNSYVIEPSFESSLNQSIERLISSGFEVVIVRNVPMQKSFIPLTLAKTAQLGGDVDRIGVPIQEIRNSNREIDRILNRLAALENVTVVDPVPLMLDENGICRAELDGESLYRDAHHLTTEGAKRLAPMFGDAFDLILPRLRSRTRLAAEPTIKH